MGVRKFRSVEEMPGPEPRTPLDPENLKIAFDLMETTHRPARPRAHRPRGHHLAPPLGDH